MPVDVSFRDLLLRHEMVKAMVGKIGRVGFKFHNKVGSQTKWSWANKEVDELL